MPCGGGAVVGAYLFFVLWRVCRRCAAVGGVVSYLFSAGGGGCAVLCIPLLSSGGGAVVVVCIHICIRICGIPMVLAFL